MILKVIKENDSLPINREFDLNPQTGMYESMERHDDIREDYEMIKQSHFAFSPSFYEANKELFNQVKLEEKDEKNKNIESKEASEDKVENLSSKDESYAGSNLAEASEEKKVLRETVEERPEESESQWRSVPEGRSSINGEAIEKQECETSDSRVSRLDAIEKLSWEWDANFNKVFEAFERWNEVLRAEMDSYKKIFR